MGGSIPKTLFSNKQNSGLAMKHCLLLDKINNFVEKEDNNLKKRNRLEINDILLIFGIFL